MSSRQVSSGGHNGSLAHMQARNRARAVFRVIFFLTLLCVTSFPHRPCAVFAQGTGAKLPNAGFRSVGVWNPDIPIRMDIAVWYPSPRISRAIQLEGWTIFASQNGVTIPGKYPVILLSHSAAESRLASHDLAAALARHGFVVIAPTHPGDNMDDTGAMYRASLFADRPAHLIMALEAVEKNATLRHILDRSRIGVLGVGSGAATALQLAGAAPDLSRLSRHCLVYSKNALVQDPYCTNWGKLFHAQMLVEFTALTGESGRSLTPAISQKTEPPAGDASLNASSGAAAPANPAGDAPRPGSPAPQPAVMEAADRPDPAEQDRPAPAPKTQPILALGLLTPGLVDLFPDEALQGLHLPVGVLAASNDEIYPPAYSVGRLQTLLRQRPALRVLQNAGHSDVQAPSPALFNELFPSQSAAQATSADDFRKIRNDFFVRFFQKTLGPPTLTPPLSEK